jgi:predicted Zn-dependent peptidase
VPRGLAAQRAAARRNLPYERSVLSNGLRVVSQGLPAARSLSAALFVGVGSRHEDDAHAGLSHLLEHLVFKGTRGYPDPGSLSAMIEACGGSVNASTDRELTVFSAKVLAEHATTALELIGELALRPLLRQHDLASEKPVIVDEIRMYVDSPSDHIFALFDELLFGRHPLGREIAGSARSVRRATRPSAVGHWQRWYRPENLVLAVAGKADHAAACAAAERWFEDAAPSSAKPPAALITSPSPAPAGSLRVAYRKLGQANLCVGMPGVSRSDPDRWALDLLGAVLGDGMSSRLFLELRERRSLAYDVSTFSSTYADCGTFGVHAGFDPEQSDRVVAAILEQLERVVQEPVTPAELDRARAYTRGRLELRMEESGAVAGWLGTGETLLPRILTLEEVIDRFAAITTDDLLRVARRFVNPSEARLAVLGPFRGARRFERLLAR